MIPVGHLTIALSTLPRSHGARLDDVPHSFVITTNITQLMDKHRPGNPPSLIGHSTVRGISHPVEVVQPVQGRPADQRFAIRLRYVCLHGNKCNGFSWPRSGPWRGQ